MGMDMNRPVSNKLAGRFICPPGGDICNAAR